MPDVLEPGIVSAAGPFDPKEMNTDHDEFQDEEDYVQETEDKWVRGSADGEDWSYPGRQSAPLTQP